MQKVVIGDTILAVLREAGDSLTASEIIKKCGKFDMTTLEYCRNGSHEDRYSTFVSCERIEQPPRWDGRVDLAGHPLALHTVNRELRITDISSVLARLLKHGFVTKLRIERFNAVLWALSPSANDPDLEALWEASNDT